MPSSNGKEQASEQPRTPLPSGPDLSQYLGLCLGTPCQPRGPVCLFGFLARLRSSERDRRPRWRQGGPCLLLGGASAGSGQLAKALGVLIQPRGKSPVLLGSGGFPSGATGDFVRSLHGGEYSANGRIRAAGMPRFLIVFHPKIKAQEPDKPDIGSN